MDYKAPAPRDASLSRAERRRLERNGGDIPGMLACKYCRSTTGTYHKHGNHFNCKTVGCKGNKGAF